MIPESDHAKALRFELRRAFGIPSPIRYAAMLATVDFDDQSMFEADEVGDIAPYRVLAAKAGMREPAACRCLGRCVTSRFSPE